jgi:hypothetical protein
LAPNRAAFVAVALTTQIFSSHAEAGPHDVEMLRAALSHHVLPCGTNFPRRLTRTELMAAFGAREVRARRVYGAEGEGPSRGDSVLFARRPGDRLQIAWDDDKAGRGAASILIRQGSRWRGPGGLRVGATLSQIAKVNGAAFIFHGLGWDYGGVYGWNGGRLDGQAGGCVVRITFDANPNVPQAMTEKIEGERDFVSDDALLRAANPVAIAIEVAPHP